MGGHKGRLDPWCLSQAPSKASHLRITAFVAPHRQSRTSFQNPPSETFAQGPSFGQSALFELPSIILSFRVVPLTLATRWLLTRMIISLRRPQATRSLSLSRAWPSTIIWVSALFLLDLKSADLNLCAWCSSYCLALYDRADFDMQLCKGSSKLR
jgi:hypothetical protein